MTFMINNYTCNRRFNWLLGKLHKSTGVEDWDYWAREIDNLIGKIKVINS